jgi:sigma-B regulation protein RsbU (phosphoserine phosphatase)
LRSARVGDRLRFQLESSGTTPQQKDVVVENHLRRYEDDVESWIHGASEAEKEAFRRLETQVLLPLSLNQKILGVLSLGPKRSEEPYTRSDLRLLGSVATQTGLALENGRLTAEIASEVAQRERLNREIEIAREVQERLFPQELAPAPGIDYAGACRPALGVGATITIFSS